MRRVLSILIGLVFSISIWAQEAMFIHQSNHLTLGVPVSSVDSVSFNEKGSLAYVSVKGVVTPLTSSVIDSICFGETVADITVIYSDNAAYVINPLAFEGVTVSVDGAHVTVNSTTDTKDINFKLSGKASDGMFKIYSKKRFNLLLGGVDLSNNSGPAINIQSNNKATILLSYGSINKVSDGETYSDAPMKKDTTQEDQKAALFSEGKLVFEGEGSLTVSGNNSEKHAICSDDVIVVNSGSITVDKSSRDAIHAKGGIEIAGGTVNVTANGDGIDGGNGYVLVSGGKVTSTNPTADTKGFTCDSTLTITGGEVSVTVSGNQSKGLTSGQQMYLNGGSITINTSGGANLEALNSGYDPKYCVGIKCDTTLTVDGATVVIKSTGTGGKGISSNQDINIKSGSVSVTTTGNGATYNNSTGTADCYNATCLTADGAITIIGGTVTLSSSGTAGKGITANGAITFGNGSGSPTVSVTTSGTKITVSGSSSTTNPGGGWGGGPGGGNPGGSSTADYSSAKAVKSDNAITINSGTITISSADDGIKSEKSITINKGDVTISKSTEAMESNLITINGGNVSITASDDGFNATAGLTAGGTEQDDGSKLLITGGTVSVNTTTGDGLDSNGSFSMTGGTVIVQGPNSSPEVGMDINGSSLVSGGLMIVSGPSSGNMIEGPDNSSTQNFVMVKSSSIGTNLFHVQDSNGKEVITFKPVRSAYYVVFSSPSLVKGSSYSIYTGGSSTGTSINGYYSGGTYTAGTQKKTFSVSGISTSVSF